jgi:hypothetical protein
VHVGYVAAPGAIAGPRGVAARGSLVAVSAWKRKRSGDHVVQIFEGSGATWTAVRVVAGGFGGPGRADGQLSRPYGLRFTSDGAGLVVADAGSDRVSMFHVADGSFVRHVATELAGPFDVEECEGGWLVACIQSDTIQFVGGGGGGGGGGAGRFTLGKRGWGWGEGPLNGPSALALVPGLGLVVREQNSGGRFQVFASPDAIAMASMSVARRVAWMVAVARGRLFRAGSTSVSQQQCAGPGRRHQPRQRTIGPGVQ